MDGADWKNRENLPNPVLCTSFFFLLCRYDTDNNHYIELMELKLMMEALGAPQTHMALKDMIKEVDEDLDNRISYREVIFKSLFQVP